MYSQHSAADAYQYRLTQVVEVSTCLRLGEFPNILLPNTNDPIPLPPAGNPSNHSANLGCSHSRHAREQRMAGLCVTPDHCANAQLHRCS